MKVAQLIKKFHVLMVYIGSHVHRSPPMDPLLSQMYPVHTLFLIFQLKFCTDFFSLLLCTTQLTLLDLIILTLLCGYYKLLSFILCNFLQLPLS